MFSAQINSRIDESRILIFYSIMYMVKIYTGNGTRDTSCLDQALQSVLPLRSYLHLQQMERRNESSEGRRQVGIATYVYIAKFQSNSMM